MRILKVTLLTLAFSNCGGCIKKEETPQPAPPPLAPSGISYSQVGPTGGVFPAVAFHPTQPGIVWASGDDGTGLYKSTDYGFTWNMVRNGILNQSTYNLRFDPQNSDILYAPNHFGRGMMKSTDAGQTWILRQAGLPLIGNNDQLLYDTAIDPADGATVFVATDSGLYKSINSGSDFSKVTSVPAGGTEVHALAYRSGCSAPSTLFMGRKDGYFGLSTDDGQSWTQLFAASGVPIEFITFSNTSLYVGFKNASVFKLDKCTFAGGLILNPSTGLQIFNSNRLAFAVKSGVTAAQDILYLGTSGQSTIPATRWGLFKSPNGGASWSHLSAGLDGVYVMSVAVDPADANRVIVGSTNMKGLFVSSNGGTSFTRIHENLYGTGSVALAQDPSNGNHLMASYTACGGFGSSFESLDGGKSWSIFADPMPDSGVFAYAIDPVNSSHILAGLCTEGIYRSTNGSSGPWTLVSTTGGKRIDRFVRDSVNKSLVYATVPEGDGSHSLYVSTDAGASFTARTGVVAWYIIPHPTQEGAAIAINGAGAWVTANQFLTTSSLNLSSQASAMGGFTTVAINPSAPNEVVIGGANGGLLKTATFSFSGGSISWNQLASPVTKSIIREIRIVSRGGRSIYYLTTFNGQTEFTSESVGGFFRSLDGGASWTDLSLQLFPAALGWSLIPDVRNGQNDFLLGMWSGGLWHISDHE